MGKHTFFHGQKWGWTPPVFYHLYYLVKVIVKFFFFEKLNNKDLYSISNFKTYEILKNDKNCIGTFNKDNVPILKTMNQQ